MCKKRFLSVFISVVLLLCAMNIPVSAETVLEGKGTELSPFLASNEAQLRMIHDFPDAYWKLTNDIELTESWTPVGTSGDNFSGTLDGNGYAIRGLSISTPFSYGSRTGFFLENHGTVKNLRLEGTVSTLGHSGGFLAHLNYGTIENCSTAGYYYDKQTTWGDHNAGGFVLNNMETGVIQNCYSLVNIIQSHFGSSLASCYIYSSGMVVTNNGIIRNCYAAGAVPSSSGHGYAREGGYGFVYSNKGTVENCVYDKETTGCSTSAGAQGKTTAAMKMEATYSAWDLDNVWAMDENVNDGYPYLRVERTFKIAAAGMTLDKEYAQVAEGGTTVLTPVFTPANATNRNVTWTTSSKYVAEVDENGVVTGISEGTAKITATAEDGGFTASCTVTVTSVQVVPDYPNGTIGDNLTWKLENGTLTISGSGAMTDFSYKDAPWYEYRNEIKAITVEEGVTSIGKDAFSRCSYAESAALPESLTKISSDSFYWCDSLKSITIPSGVESISSDAFDVCQALEEITVSPNNNMFCADDGVLFNKDKTKLLIYPAGKADEEYSVPDGVGTIGWSAFYMNYNLKKLNIPDSVTTMESYCISACNLTIYASSSSCAKAYSETVGGITFVATDAPAPDYTVNSLSGEELQNGRFRVRASVTKNNEREDIDAIVIALYDKNGAMVDYIFMEAQFAQGQTVNFGGTVEDAEGVTVKAFVWDSLDNMIPLSNTASL